MGDLLDETQAAPAVLQSVEAVEAVVDPETQRRANQEDPPREQEREQVTERAF